MVAAHGATFVTVQTNDEAGNYHGGQPDMYLLNEKSVIMKIIVLAASLLALTSVAMAADVGVSVTVGQPGFYGRIDIGDFPPPRVIYTQPRIVERSVRYEQAPIYLRVPPGHAKNWSKHCRAYNACNQRVYFVQDGWYTNEYAPRYREQHGRQNARRDDGRGEQRGPGNGHGNERGNERGNGHGNGHGDGRGNEHGRGKD
jgi:hypothetical protein